MNDTILINLPLVTLKHTLNDTILIFRLSHCTYGLSLSCARTCHIDCHNTEVCVRACVSTNVCARTCLRVYACVRACVNARACVCARVCVRVRICINGFVCVRARVCVAFSVAFVYREDHARQKEEGFYLEPLTHR